MIPLNQVSKKLRSFGKHLLPSLIVLALLMSQQTIFAQRLAPLAHPQNSQKPCAADDVSEVCQLRRAVKAAIEDIEKLKGDLAKAKEAIAEQEKTIQAAQDLAQKAAAERDAADRTIAAAQKVIDAQTSLMQSYERAIATLQSMVTMALQRIEKLEDKVDRANARSARLGVLLTIAGIVATVIIKR